VDLGVAGYLDILVETLLRFRLFAFEARLRVRERKLPKWYWCDPGIVRVMKRTGGPPWNIFSRRFGTCRFKPKPVSGKNGLVWQVRYYGL